MMTIKTASTNTTVTAVFWSGCRRGITSPPRRARPKRRIPPSGRRARHQRPPPERLDADHPPGGRDGPGTRLCQHVIQVSPGHADVVPGHQRGGRLAQERAPATASWAAGIRQSPWWRLTRLSLALAVREADGKLLIDDVVLDALPRFAGAAAEILRRAGLLDSTCDRLPGRRGSLHRVGPGPRSCQTCGAWGTRRRCEACRQWEASGSCEPGACQRCGHADVPLRGGRCRACLVHIRAHGPAAACQSWGSCGSPCPAPAGRRDRPG